MVPTGSIVRGSFGWWTSDYERGPDRVIVRRTWRPAVLLPLLPIGVAALTMALRAGPSAEGELVIAACVAAVGLSGGLAAAIAAPWTPIRTIACTRAGLVVDGVVIAPAATPALAVATRTYRRGEMFHEVGITVTRTGAPTRTLHLYRRRGEPDTTVVEQLVDAMRAMLEGAARAADAARVDDQMQTP